MVLEKLSRAALLMCSMPIQRLTLKARETKVRIVVSLRFFSDR
jgi:hypothetical protein